MEPYDSLQAIFFIFVVLPIAVWVFAFEVVMLGAVIVEVYEWMERKWGQRSHRNHK